MALTPQRQVRMDVDLTEVVLRVDEATDSADQQARSKTTGTGPASTKTSDRRHVDEHAALAASHQLA